jgi:hydrogenase maturation protease
MASPAQPLGRTVVLGLGNPLLRDDGVGLAVARELHRLLQASPVPGVDVLASARAGFELLDLLQGYTRAVLVDCLTPPDPAPGRVHRLRPDDVAGSARLVDAHGLGIAQALDLAERLGIPMPARVEIFGVEAADTRTFEEGLTPAVQAAAGSLAREIHARLLAEAPGGEVLDGDEFVRRRRLFAPPG